MRREFLKGYLLALMAEDRFRGMSAAGVVRKALTVVAEDVPIVAAEILKAGVEQTLDKVGALVRDKVSKIDGQKLTAVLSNIQAIYNRGMDSNNTRGGK